MIKQGSRGERPILEIFKSVLNELLKFNKALVEVCWGVTSKNSQ